MIEENEIQEMDFDFKKNIVIRRLVELLLTEALLSVLATILNVTGLVTQRYALVILLGAFIILFVVLNVRNMRKCFYDVRDNKTHYLMNFIAYGVFVVVNVGVYLVLPSTVHTWFFSLTKILCFLDIEYFVSFTVFHIIGVLAVIVAPAGMVDKILRWEAEY